MLAATKIIEDLRRESDALKAKLADSEAALHRFQHSQQIEGDYVCDAALKERAVIDDLRKQLAASESARLKAEVACAAMRSQMERQCEEVEFCMDCKVNPGEQHKLPCALSTDAGQPILDFIAAARRLNDGVKLFIKVMAGEVRADKECPSFPQLVADVDAADAKLGV